MKKRFNITGVCFPDQHWTVTSVDQAHKNGLNQLSDYLNRLGLQDGVLLILDHQEQKR